MLGRGSPQPHGRDGALRRPPDVRRMYIRKLDGRSRTPQRGGMCLASIIRPVASCPEGTREISRWCKPPVCYESEFQALAGRRRLRDAVPTPLAGLDEVG